MIVKLLIKIKREREREKCTELNSNILFIHLIRKTIFKLKNVAHTAILILLLFYNDLRRAKIITSVKKKYCPREFEWHRYNCSRLSPSACSFFVIDAHAACQIKPQKIQGRQRPVDQSQFSHSDRGFFTSAASALSSDRRRCASSYKDARFSCHVLFKIFRFREIKLARPARYKTIERVIKNKINDSEGGNSEMRECEKELRNTWRWGRNFQTRAREKKCRETEGRERIKFVKSTKTHDWYRNDEERVSKRWRSSANERYARTAVDGQLRVSLENRKDDARRPATSRWRWRQRGREAVVWFANLHHATSGRP